MPLDKLDKVISYCTYNKLYFVFILILVFLSNVLQDFVRDNLIFTWWLVQFIVMIVVFGYGMEITGDRINHGVRLPKIRIKNILIMGFKSLIVVSVYLFIQLRILGRVCSALAFPMFDLKELLLNFPNTIRLFYYHNPVHTLLFITFGAFLFYAISFFTEIALARLADTKSVWQAFNLIAIKKSIDIFGWRRYAKDYTIIIVTMVILTYVKSLLPPTFVWHLLDLFLGFLIFATEYLGIGAVYCEMKDLETKLNG